MPLTKDQIVHYLKEPFTTMDLLRMYEGLARACQDLKDKVRTSPDATLQETYDHYRGLYLSQVGIEFEDRGTVRDEVLKQIQKEARVTIPAAG